MTSVVIGAYGHLNDVRKAADELADSDVELMSVSVLASDPSEHYRRWLEDNPNIDQIENPEHSVDAGEGAAVGALSGLVVGLATAFAPFVIPAIGPVVAAGPLVAGLTGGTVGAAGGALTGGLVAALVDMGIAEDDAETYAETLEKGGALLAVEVTEDDVDETEEIMNRHDPTAVNEAEDIEWAETQA